METAKEKVVAVTVGEVVKGALTEVPWEVAKVVVERAVAGATLAVAAARGVCEAASMDVGLVAAVATWVVGLVEQV